MNAGNSHPPLSKALRIVGAIVILATVIVIVIPTIWLFWRQSFNSSRYVEGLVVQFFVVNLGICGLGGPYLAIETKNAWWLVPMLAMGVLVTLWLLIAGAMGPLMH